MHLISFHVQCWGAWPDAGSANLPTVSPPAALRRRITPLGQEALRLAWAVPGAVDARIILSSRHGEFSRTSSILDALVANDTLSPADFTLSVHHALAGVLSIASGNRKGHVAVSAGRESFCYALLEAAACLAENPDEHVLVMHYDEPLPAPFSAFDEVNAVPEALVLLLSAAGEGAPISIQSLPTPAATAVGGSHAKRFIGFLQDDRLDEQVSAGERLTWRWRRHAAAA